MRVGQGRTAVSLMGRVREGSEGSPLVVAGELGAHVRSAAVLAGVRAEVGTRGEGHLALVSGLRVATPATTAVMGIATTTRRAGISDVISTHVAVGRLRGFASQMSRLGTVSEWSLGCRAHLSG